MRIPTTLLLLSLLASPLACQADEPATTVVSGTVTLVGDNAPGQILTAVPSTPSNVPPGAPGSPQNPFTLTPNSGSGDLHNLTIYMTPKLVKAAYLGVAVTAADQTLQSQLGLPEGVGLVIRNVDPQSPAQSAGLQDNDVITRLNDQIIINPNQFEVLVRSHKPGESLEITVIRRAQSLKLSVTLIEKEEPELSWVLNNYNHAFFSPPLPSTASIPLNVTMSPQPPK